MQTAIEIMRAEHRTLGAAIHALVGIVDTVVARSGRPDFNLLRALLGYIDQFPDQFHHPKEDQYLFRLLRLRAPEAEGDLAQLEDEHRVNKELMISLCNSLEVWRKNPDFRDALLHFQSQVKHYADFHWAHMRREENNIFPLAESRLLPEDWAELNTAFAGNHDPLFGLSAKEHYDEMLRRIVLHAPDPYGVGARW
jgi:hemerythrin-like domain-containing protein